MNILVVGNGFDLFHGLPTSYNNFLDFCNIIIKNSSDLIISIEEFNNTKLQEIILKNKDIEEYNYYTNELIDCLERNIWYKYFLDKREKIVDSWIDFEQEMKKVIISCEEMQKYRIHSCMNIIPEIVRNMYHDKIESELFDIAIDVCDKNIGDYRLDYNYQLYNKFINILILDLQKFIRAFEIYLDLYVNKIHIEKEVLCSKIINIKIDKVISFNYTDTFKRLYDIGGTEYEYVHGKATLNRKIADNNIVLGIDEYLSDKDKDTNIDFIEFKKYYQRIYKKTGANYKQWVSADNALILNSDDFHYDNECVIFFGHSLDISDKDILKEIIEKSIAKRTIVILYHNDYARRCQIINLVKIIGQDKLIEYTSNNHIIFERI